MNCKLLIQTKFNNTRGWSWDLDRTLLCDVTICNVAEIGQVRFCCGSVQAVNIDTVLGKTQRVNEFIAIK